MKKIRVSRKPWIVAHAKKGVQKRVKLHKTRRKRRRNKEPESNKSSSKKWTVVAPQRLSLTGNCEETLEYFAEVLETIQSCDNGDQIYFDFQKIKYISSDAIMYIIALITNAKKINECSIRCSGNLPTDPKARDTLEMSGFYKFVQHKNSPVSSVNDRLQISSGKDIDSPLVGAICEYVQKVSGTPCDTNGLYSIIIELMTNTAQHAYHSEDDIMDNNWYIFAQNSKDYIRFVFLDTGVGIPKTIKKRLGERFRGLVDELTAYNAYNGDASYIESALKGEERTETNQPYRGQGLPEVYEVACGERISEMLVMSGRGKCRIGADGLISNYSLSTEFVGTLFTWKFMKKRSD